MDCKTIDQKLIFYLEGDLAEQESRMIAQHIESCLPCAAKLEYLRSSLALIQVDKQQEVKPFLFTRIQGKMASHPQMVKQWTLASLMVTSVLFIGLFFGSLLGKISIPAEQNLNEKYSVSYLFDDIHLESMEYKLLND